MTASVSSAGRIGMPSEHRPASATLNGTTTMVGFVLRRNRVRLLLLWLAIVALFAYVEAYYRQVFTTQAALDDFAKVSNVPSIKALTGLADAPATMGGAVWTKIWMTCAFMLAFGVMFLVTRNGRADEEAGRTELLRSRSLGLHAYSAATWLWVFVLCAAAGASIAIASIAGGLDPAGSGITGSLITGASITGIGLVALGVTALAGQLTATSRAANGLAATAIGAFYVLRMLGDLGDGRLTWLSPIGWGEEMQPWGANRWWPLGLMLLLALAFLAATTWLESHRDLGEAVISERAGRASAPARYARPLGLAVRLQRGPIIGWTVTVALSAMLFGSVIDTMNDFMANANQTIATIMRGTGVDALLALLVTIIAMITTVFATQTTLTLRADEANGLIEHQLTGAISRTNWAVQRLIIPMAGSAMLLLLGGGLLGFSYGNSVGQTSQTLSLAVAALTYWPAVMVLVGIAVLLFGCLPRLAIQLSWGVLAATWTVVLVGDALRLPSWLLDLLPISATPYQPLEPMSWMPVAWLSVAATGFIWIGLARFAHRDVQTG